MTGISLFEAEHDPETKDLFFVAMHSAGEDPKPLAESDQQLADKNKYDLDFVFRGEDAQWSDVAQEVIDIINKKGSNHGYQVSISNFSFGSDRKVAVILSWEHEQDQMFTEQTREDGCCTIF